MHKCFNFLLFGTDGAFSAGKIDPVPLLPDTFLVDDLVFQNAAVMHDGLGRADIIPITGHQYPGNPQLSALVQGQADHGGGIALPARAGADPVADMAAGEEQGGRQIVADVDGTHENLPV